MAKRERKKGKKKKKLMYLDGEEQFQLMCLDFYLFIYLFFTEMNTFGSPKFSARFEHLG